LLLALACAQTPPPTASVDAAALIASLARPAPASTAFTEVRFVRVLRKPLVLHGMLEYDGPGRLGKRVDAPYHEITTIADASVKVEREGRRPAQFDLERAPELKALLTGFSALLGGDAATLQQLYALELTRHAPSWRLTLVPRVPALARHLRALVVDGNGAEPVCFTSQLADGDSGVMLLGGRAAAQLPEPATAPALARLCAQP